MPISILITALAAAAQAAASPADVAHGPLHGPPPPRVSGADSCLPLMMASGHPVIPVQLGSKTYHLVFDTGAPGGPMLRPEVIRELGLQKIGQAGVSDPSLKNVATVSLFGLPEMKVGALTIQDWVAMEPPPRDRRFGEPDGVFGPQAFAGYVVTFDYPGGRLLIRKGQLPDADNRTSFSYPGAIPQVPLTVDGGSIRAHVDTGNARYGLILPREFASKLPGFGKSYAIGTARTANNRYDLSAFPVASVSVGGMALYAGSAAYPGPAQHANIGSILLRDMVVTLDPSRKIVAFARASGSLESGCPNT